MTILAINGSSRAGKGNTQKVLDRLLLSLSETEYKIVFPARDKISPCLDCQKCFINNGTCILNDPMRGYLKAITESDLVILATPIYTNFMTASLKLVLDRLRPLQTGGYRLNRRGDFAPVLKSSKAYHFLLVATCGFPEIKTFNTLETWFDHFVDQYDEFGMAGKILLPAAPVVMKTGPIRNRFYAELDKHLMHLTSRTYFEVKKEWIGKEEIIEAMKRVNVFESHSE